MLIFLYLCIALLATCMGIMIDRIRLRSIPTTVGDVIMYFILGLIPLANVYTILYGCYLVIEERRIFSYVILESPNVIKAKKKKAEQELKAEKNKQEKNWEEF